MKIQTASIAAVICTVIVIGSLMAVRPLFAGRILPGIWLGEIPLAGIARQHIPGVITLYQEQLQNQAVEVKLKDQKAFIKLGDLGITIDGPKTLAALDALAQAYSLPQRHTIKPVINLDETLARETLHQKFASTLKLPMNATLQLASGDQLVLVPGKSGEQIDVITLEEDIQQDIGQPYLPTIELTSVLAPPPVEDKETAAARTLAQELVKNGLKLSFDGKEFEVKPFTVKRLITFVEQADLTQANNHVLGVAFNPIELKSYLETTIAPEVNRQPINARFELKDERVEQFAVPQDGRTLNLEATAQAINSALSQGQTSTQLAVDITTPDIAATTDIAKLGIDQLIAKGETDFKGSPKNRIHNIEVGTSRYHGLLIPPNSEFSFLEFLGPVDGEHGFKPELVIKTNVTVPEFGGGLCQVSTTTFRAAVEAGLKIVQRKNHSYAVRYYGTPGFDATIYPPYTDLRFLNNTPAYILIQTKIEGTKLTFELYGTKDGRTVTIDGPHPYSRQPDGAVKATLKQTVALPDGQTIIEDTFYSNYKSPNLFPHVVAASGETAPGQVAGAQTNVPGPTPTPAPATPHPKPAN
ncbi:MAG: VanW family protein [Candidatus Andersenbacteria bacterium]|nr:VanW family protein [Candidatus Andersenbacteria bacterium]